MQVIDKLKSEGHFFAAGALAYAMGKDNYYGCHFGMRSSREKAIRQYEGGWEAAKKAVA